MGWRLALAAAGLLALSGCDQPVDGPGGTLGWAYPRGPKAPLPTPPPGALQVPGGTMTMTVAQASDDKNPPDWFPQEHPTPPASVAHERPGGAMACAECHLFNGQGFLGAPSLAGLPAAYIVRQVQDFRSGARTSAETGRPATGEMIGVAKKVTDAELAEAAAYFAALPRRSWVRTVEVDRAPAVHPNYYGWQDRIQGEADLPLKGRIVEVADDWPRMILEDPHSGVVAYVPRGAIARGEALAKAGGPAGQPCVACHGKALSGDGEVPPLAGRSPAYLARMLWDLKTGARHGAAAAPMRAVAAPLNGEQITDLVAYLASRAP